jgi:malate dehydrogenase
MGCMIAVIGSGDIARTVALLLTVRGADEVVLVGAPPATALDAGAAGVLLHADTRLRRADSLQGAAGARVAVLTDGPVELAATGADVARHLPDAVLLVAGEPVDVACAVLLRATAVPRGRVLGATAPAPGARLRAALAETAGVSVHDVVADVLGGPGERAVPVLSQAAIAGVPAAGVLGEATVEALAAGVGDGDPADRSALAAAAVEVVESVVGDRRRLLTCAIACRGELGIDGAVTGVPVRVGGEGAEAIVEPLLAPGELDALHEAASAARDAAEAVPAAQRAAPSP